MDKNRNVSTRIAMILNCICAVVWSIDAFLSLYYGFPSVLRILCAVVWDFSAIVWIVRYLKTRKKDR